MDQQQIFGPFFGVMLLTIVVWLWMYAKRIPFINSLDLEPNQITPAELAKRSPPSVSNPSDNLRNLFEVPVLFYAAVLYVFVTATVDQVYLVAAWAYFVLRVLHSAIHCTINIVMMRFVIYVLSCACVFFMIVRAALSHFV
ncbi:MAG: MAPEG family protein [Gammaproteobacteria bacterium]|jgi:hypothetical protein